MSFFDKALSGVLDGIERNVVDQVREAAAAALEEYPGQDAPTQAVKPAGIRTDCDQNFIFSNVSHLAGAKLWHITADWDKAAQAISYWRLFNLEVGPHEALEKGMQLIVSLTL